MRRKAYIKMLGGLISLGFFYSCECSRQAKGLVLDETTQEPLDSVLVEALTITKYGVYSDSLGSYFISSGMTGAVGGCPDYEVSFSKEGYHSQTLVNPDGNVYLKAK